MKTLLRGGYVVSGRGCRRADVLIDGEKVEMLGHIPPELAAQSEVVDVTGCMLFPGFIDAHTHFDLDVCNTTTADDFESGSKSAIRGGTTTVIDFACPNKGESLAYGLDLWHKKADGKCYCDYGFHMTIDDWNESIESELDAMFDAGKTAGDLRKVVAAHVLLLERERAVVGRDGLHLAAAQRLPERFTVFLRADRRRADVARGGGKVGIVVNAVVERQILRAGFDIHGLSAAARRGDLVKRSTVRRVDDDDGRVGRLRDAQQTRNSLGL